MSESREPSEDLLSRDFADLVLARAELEQRRARRLRGLAGLAGAAALALVIALPRHRHAPPHAFPAARPVAVAALEGGDPGAEAADEPDEDPGDEFFPDAPEVASAEPGE